MGECEFPHMDCVGFSSSGRGGRGMITVVGKPMKDGNGVREKREDGIFPESQ